MGTTPTHAAERKWSSAHAKKFMHIFLFAELFYVLILSKYITELLGAGVRGSNNIRVDSSKDPQTCAGSTWLDTARVNSHHILLGTDNTKPRIAAHGFGKDV